MNECVAFVKVTCSTIGTIVTEIYHFGVSIAPTVKSYAIYAYHNAVVLCNFIVTHIQTLTA